MVWIKIKDYYDYNPSKDKSYFRAIAERRPSNDILPDEAHVDTSVKDVEEKFIYPK
jgi:hypothetical protein